MPFFSARLIFFSCIFLKLAEKTWLLCWNSMVLEQFCISPDDCPDKLLLVTSTCVPRVTKRWACSSVIIKYKLDISWFELVIGYIPDIIMHSTVGGFMCIPSCEPSSQRTEAAKRVFVFITCGGCLSTINAEHTRLFCDTCTCSCR